MRLNNKMKKKNPKICTIYYNCSAHMTDIKFDNIKMIYLHINNIWKSQPMNTEATLLRESFT